MQLSIVFQLRFLVQHPTACHKRSKKRRKITAYQCNNYNICCLTTSTDPLAQHDYIIINNTIPFDEMHAIGQHTESEPI